MKALVLRAAALMLSLALLIGACAAAEEPRKLYAPDFTFYDIDGSAHSFSDYLGKPVILNLWATWCPPCRAELPYYNTAIEEYGDRITFLMISLDNDDNYVQIVNEFLAENAYSFDAFLDPQLSSLVAYGVSSIPVSIFIAPDGELLAWQVGMLNSKQLNACITVMLEDAVAETGYAEAE